MEGLRIWYDAEGDFLEVNFARGPGSFQQTSAKNIMLKRNQYGQIIGFSVLNISAVAEAPLEIEIPCAEMQEDFAALAMAK